MVTLVKYSLTRYESMIKPFTRRFVKNENWNKIGNLIQRREGHFSWEYEGVKIISCGGQNLAKLYASCEAFDLKGKSFIKINVLHLTSI